MKMRPIDVLNNLKGHVLWPQSYHLSEAEAEVCIKALEQESKTGHWIEMPIGFKCSECNELEDRTTKFCPTCGAKMVEPQERSE